jgi:HSP20 family protein
MFLMPMIHRRAALRCAPSQQFDSRVERYFADHSALSRSPALDLSESDTAYTVRIDMPGVAKDDIKVSIEGRRVSVEAEQHKDAEKKDGDRVVYRERSSSSYSRRFTLAAEVDEAASTAKLDNGVLTLT